MPAIRRFALGILLCVILLCGCAPSAVEPISNNELTQEQRSVVEMAEGMFFLELTVSTPPTEREKAAFLFWILSTDLVQDKQAQWFDGSVYRIPIAEIEQILYAHLDTDSFDPQQGFDPLNGGTKGYNSASGEYVLPMLGGYGGVRAFGVLSYKQEGDRITLTLGSYDVPSYYAEDPVYTLLSRYEAELIALPERGQYKVISAKHTPIS